MVALEVEGGGGAGRPARGWTDMICRENLKMTSLNFKVAFVHAARERYRKQKIIIGDIIWC